MEPHSRMIADYDTRAFDFKQMIGELLNEVQLSSYARGFLAEGMELLLHDVYCVGYKDGGGKL